MTDHCEEGMYKTIKGLTCFFADLIRKTGHDVETLDILKDIKDVYVQWDKYWPNIKNWLRETEMTDQKTVLDKFIDSFPQLMDYKYMLHESLDLDFHQPIWCKFFENIVHCKEMLNKEECVSHN